MKKSISIIFLLVFIIGIASATCTVSFERTYPEPYYSGETVVATMICDSSIEKAKSYTLTWAYENGTELELDLGITPTEGIYFFDTLDTTGITGIINATLTGSNLEGFAQANITGQKVNSLFIKNAEFSPTAFLGSLFSIEFQVNDINDKRVDGAYCSVYSTDQTNAPLQECGVVSTHDGIATCSSKLNNEVFKEGQEYLAKVRCSCSNNSCFNEDGDVVSSGAGSITYDFTTSTWLTSNTLTNKDSYIGREEMFICANLTNVEYLKRIPVEIYHQVRCSRGDDNNNDTDRALIFKDDGMPDERGVSVGETQTQCKRFIVPELSYMQGTTSTCYASTSVWVLNDNREKIKSYVTSSPEFNITVDDINIDADWQRIDDGIFNTIVNLSEERYSYLSPTTVGNIDIRLDKNYIESIRAEDQYYKHPQNMQNFIEAENIRSFVAYSDNGTLMETVLEFLDDGNVEIEVRNVDLQNHGYVNLTMEFYNFNERQTLALEGINNSAGTFDFSITVPNTDENFVVVAGEGKTGDGRILNRDLNVKCEVQGHNDTYTEFKVYCTDTFAFTQKISNIPDKLGTYTMDCTAIDRFFGEDAVNAVANFEKTNRGGLFMRVFGRQLTELERIVCIILGFILLWLILIIITKKNKK